MKHKMAYTPDSTISEVLLNTLYQKVDRTTHLNPHPGLIIATHHFLEPYPLVNEIDLLSLSAMGLLIQFAYPSLSGYGKITISYFIKQSYGEEFSFTIGPAIPLTYQDCTLIPMIDVYAQILRDIIKYAEIYDGYSIVKLMIRVYVDTSGEKTARAALSSEERDRTLSSIIEERDRRLSSMIEGGLSETERLKAREIQNRKRSYPTHIKALKQYCTELKPFMVADIETLKINDVHKPYAAGLLMVRPGEQINDILIDTYFSEDYCIILDSFEERSTKVLYDLVLRISTIVRQEQSCLTIYFHNLSRFDGIFLLRHLACHHKNYKLKPLLRNKRVYEIAVYSGKKQLFRFRDSLNLLPGSLDSLAKNLCPGLGAKGTIDHDNVFLSNLSSMKILLLDYMKQDILLLGGVMQKAQEIYWKLYTVDIERKITLPSLALSIFRMKYYDASNWPIHIPNKNEDSFIRRAYYGGHTDTYKPYGEGLYSYDVNSLYPFVMKEFPMPGGVPVWHGNLEGQELSNLFGFIEAYVVCPKTINKPFLPYRDKTNTLIFPTGEFVGVYYSEELKYARELGYTVLPISGYLFERMESPFRDCVSTLFECRLEARKSGNEAMAYVYKILMNSLYGRFGINPKSTMTEICDKDRYDHLLKHSELISCDMLSEDNYIVAYHSNTGRDSEIWNPPRISAVQLAAAITASARIHMYPYISREDCYYTDTDSVVLGQPLPTEVISSSVLGKFKLEAKIRKGIFLAPKSYYYIPMDGKPVIKHKGAAKSKVYPEWFEKQYADPSRTELVQVSANFRIDWHTLNIIKKDTWVKLGIKLGTKRAPLYHDDIWVDTVPIEVTDLSCLNNIGKRIIKSLRNEVIQQQTENEILKGQLAQKERKMKFDDKKRIDTQSTTEIQTSLTEDRTLLDKEEAVTNPTLDEKIPTRKTMAPELMKKRINDLDDPPNDR